MAKKNLKDKIIDAVFWTCFFLVVYLIVGFLLGSSWLSKGLTFKESYDLLKDGLSLTAAFLAPVAAFVLFSDWREQHVERRLDEIARSIILSIQDIYSVINLSQFEGIGLTYMGSGYPKKQSIEDMFEASRKNIDEMSRLKIDTYELAIHLYNFKKTIEYLDAVIKIGVMSRPRGGELTVDDIEAIQGFCDAQDSARDSMDRIFISLDRYVIHSN